MQVLLKLLAAVPIDASPLPKVGNDVVINIFNLVFAILTGIAFISVVYGGFKYVLSRGEPDKIGKAKDIIMYSLIGLVVAFCAFGIVNILLKAIKT